MNIFILISFFIGFILLIIKLTYITIKHVRLGAKLKQQLIKEKIIDDSLDYGLYIKKRIPNGILSNIENIYDKDDSQKVTKLKEQTTLSVREFKIQILYIILYILLIMFLVSVWSFII